MNYQKNHKVGGIFGEFPTSKSIYECVLLVGWIIWHSLHTKASFNFRELKTFCYFFQTNFQLKLPVKNSINKLITLATVIVSLSELVIKQRIIFVFFSKEKPYFCIELTLILAGMSTTWCTQTESLFDADFGPEA